jgi:hypothetical protein
MGRHLDHRKLIDRGRKAGLNTSEIYRAMGVRPNEDSSQGQGQSDGNGFVISYDKQGRALYHPRETGPR